MIPRRVPLTGDVQGDSRGDAGPRGAAGSAVVGAGGSTGNAGQREEVFGALLEPFAVLVPGIDRVVLWLSCHLARQGDVISFPHLRRRQDEDSGSWSTER